MPLASNMMGGGVPSGAAQAINGIVNSSVSSAGSSLATATALKADHSVLTTVSSGQGVSLPDGVIGDTVFIYNSTATECLVYPATTSQTINQLSAGVAMVLPPYTAVWFKRATSTAWNGFMSA